MTATKSEDCGLECKEETSQTQRERDKFMVDAKPNREPVEFFQHRSDMTSLTLLGLRDDPDSDVPNML